MEKLFLALMELANPIVILIIFLGVSAGLFVGAMPGLTATMALAVLLPFTFTMPPLLGLVALGAVYMGAIYGGSFAAILVNTPGTPSSITTANRPSGEISNSVTFPIGMMSVTSRYVGDPSMRSNR